MNKEEALKQALREVMRLVVERGEPLTDELRDMLMQVTQHVGQRIQEARAEQQAPVAPPPAPVQKIEQGPPSADAQLLWILAGQQPEQFTQYLQNYPSPATQNLLNNESELQRTIEFLQRMMPHGEPPVINGIRHTDINSSVVWGTQYNPQTGQMKVRFQNGSVYEYDGVPQNIYKAFASGAASAKTDGQNKYGRWWVNKNPSIGAALNQYIKANNFTYRKLQ
jgi:hypothetical protein